MHLGRHQLAGTGPGARVTHGPLLGDEPGTAAMSSDCRSERQGAHRGCTRRCAGSGTRDTASTALDYTGSYTRAELGTAPRSTGRTCRRVAAGRAGGRVGPLTGDELGTTVGNELGLLLGEALVDHRETRRCAGSGTRHSAGTLGASERTRPALDSTGRSTGRNHWATQPRDNTGKDSVLHGKTLGAALEQHWEMHPTQLGWHWPALVTHWVHYWRRARYNRGQ
jgi:hypothetical protein